MSEMSRKDMFFAMLNKALLIMMVVMMMFTGITQVNAEETTSSTTETEVTETKLSLTSASIVLDSSSYYYTGSARTPSAKVYYGSTLLVEGTDYTLSYSNNVNVGLATVTAEGINDYTDNISTTFEIKLKTVSELTIKGVPDTKTYTGKQITPAVTVYDGSTLLSEDTDYTVTYGSNKSTGKATITVEGKGKYTGTITKTFYIVPKKTSIKSVKASADKKLTVKWSKVTGASGYQVAYKTKNGSWKYTTTTSTSKTISGLKRGTKYYVKVRAYKSVDGVKKYGSWSDSKTQTTLTYRQVRINKLISVAKSKLGCKYKYGAAGPTRFDCSGFTMYCYKQIGVSLKHSSSAQGRTGKKVSIKNLKVGDIVYRSGHVGIYVGNGKAIHAPRSGKSVCYIKVSYFSYGRRII